MKNLKKYLYLFSFLFLFFIPKAHARIILPALPSGFDENWNHIISYDAGDGGLFHLTYCKSINQTLHLRTLYPADDTGDLVFIGECYDSGGNFVNYAYHNRSVSSVPLTVEQINNYDFEVDFQWRNYENQPSIGLSIDSTTRKIKTWKNYVGQISENSYDSVVIAGNTSIYNTSSLYNEVLLSEEDYAYSDNNDSINCPGKTRQLIGQASNITSFNFSINGSVNYEDESLFNGYFEIHNSFWNDTYPSLNDIEIIYHLVDSDSTIPDIDDLIFSTTKEYVLDSNNNRYLRINISINSNVSYDNPVSVFLTVNVLFNNYVLSSVANPYYFYSKNNVCNSTIIGYGYNNNLTGLYYGSNPILENYLKNYSPPNISTFNNFNSILPPGPVDAILTLPLSILNSLTSNLGSSCTPLTLTLPFINSNITLPCMNNFYDSIGLNNFMSWLGVIVSVIMLINYFVYLYNWIESIIMLSHKKFKAWGTGEV